MKYNKLLLIAGLSFTLFACRKDLKAPTSKEDPTARFPTTEKEKQTVESLKELGSILKVIYKNLWVSYEVNAAIKTGYYTDERVMLRDLVFPDQSPIYKMDKFAATRSKTGVFRKAFLDELNKGNYPNLQKAIFKQQGPNHLDSELPPQPGVDTTNEIWTDANGYSIYFPYSENFPLVNPLDVTNNTVMGQLVTVASADRDADSGPAWEPYLCAADPNQPMGFDNLAVCYNSVTVDDGYAELVPLHILGVGGEPDRVDGTNGTTQVYVVMVGEVRCTHQYDHLISFSGNGGGSELRFIRGSAYLVQDNLGQITNPQNVISADMSRKDIRKGRWRNIYSIWDANWVEANLQQVFGIYEEDNAVSKTFSGSLSTTLGSGTVGPMSFSFTVLSKDDIIKQLNWDRTSFYQYNQGGLNNGCGTRNGWTIYDCNLNVSYTLPTQ